MNTGWDLRLDILRRGAKSILLMPLRTHGWPATAKRVLPERFQERITAQQAFAKQSGAW